MRISGLLDNSLSLNISYDNFFLINYCINCFHSGIDWTYTYIENLYFYDFKIWYFWALFSIFDDSFDFFLQSYWYININVSTFNLVYSVIMDLFLNSSLVKNYFTDSWFRNFISSQEMSLFVINHP